MFSPCVSDASAASTGFVAGFELPAAVESAWPQAKHTLAALHAVLSKAHCSELSSCQPSDPLARDIIYDLCLQAADLLG